MENFWSQPLRVECTEHVQLITSRTTNSRLWFVNNPRLENRILAFLAKYASKYQAKLFAFVIVGNHYHLLAEFPNGQRSDFFRDFNARVAEAVRLFVPEFLGGPLFERRFTPQVLPLDEDVEKYFFYCALQPVSSGLTEKISQYDSYNSFSAAAGQRKTTYKLFNYGKYNAARRTNPSIPKGMFFEEHSLEFEKLPHLKELTRNAYKEALLKTLEEKRIELVKDRNARKKKFFGQHNLRKVIPGSLPIGTKKGGQRPLVLSCSIKAKQQILDWYFDIVSRFKAASEKFRSGNLTVEFPPGTFRPHGMCFYKT